MFFRDSFDVTSLPACLPMSLVCLKKSPSEFMEVLVIESEMVVAALVAMATPIVATLTVAAVALAAAAVPATATPAAPAVTMLAAITATTTNAVPAPVNPLIASSQSFWILSTGL